MRSLITKNLIRLLIFTLAIIVFPGGCSNGRNDNTDLKPTPDQQPKASVKDPRAAVNKSLSLTNPGYRNNARFLIKKGQITAIEVSGQEIRDISCFENLRLEAVDLRGTAISDISPLKGMSLQYVFLENTNVDDITPLRGMPIRELYLSNTQVTDLSPLKGMSLEKLNLLGCPVSDLESLAGMTIDFLWLNQSSIIDITPLKDCRIMSLTLKSTAVQDISPLKDMKSLKRLHIGDTSVEDISPLEGLTLERLIFDPGNIRKGIEVVEQMGSLREMGITLDNKMNPQLFWKIYRQGRE